MVVQQEKPSSNTNVLKPINTDWAARTPPPIEPLPTNEDPYSQPQKPLGFALGSFFMYTYPLGGFFHLLEGYNYQAAFGGLYTTLFDSELVIVACLVAEHLLTILLGILRFASWYGLTVKKPYGYYLTQASLILELIFPMLSLSTYFIINSNGIQTGDFPISQCFGILLFLSWSAYFEKRKFMFVPNLDNPPAYVNADGRHL